ncbi:MAG: preprotein translocase subunit SecE [Candidatus Cloacimonetes bacterium]|nr:preprotein translocase subunit SecE [Candidatus Cloacimonadota bacterium]
MIQGIIKFFKDVRQELKYVTWPTRADIKEGTVVVIVMSAIVALFLSGVDAIFSMIIRFILLR